MISSVRGDATSQNENQSKIPEHLDPIVKLFNIVVGVDLTHLEKMCIKALVASFKTHKLTYISQFNPTQLTKLKDLAHKTIMIHAIKQGQEGLIEYFVKNNIAIHDPDIHGNTPLHYAVRKNLTQSIPLLLNQYPFIKLNDATQSPLHVGIIEGRHDAVLALLEKGNDVLIAVKEEGGTWTPLALAVKHGYPKCIDLLLDKVPLLQEVANSANLLHVAIQYRHPETVEYLLFSDKVVAHLKEKDISLEKFIEKKNSDGQTPLSLAAKLGDVISIQLLFDKGATLETEDFYRKRPIHHAVNERQLEAVKLLTLLGADIKACDSEGKTPLEIVRNDTSLKGCAIFEFLSSLEKIEFSLSDEQKLDLVKSGYEAAKSYFENSFLQTSSSSNIESYPRYISIPETSLEKPFEGQELLFHQLGSFCLPKGWKPNTATPFALLTTSAIDKTEAAVAFANRHAENFSLIKYINCKSKESILQGYQELAEFFHITWDGENTIEQINQEFGMASSSKKPWLLILDHVKSDTIKTIPLPKKGGAILALCSDNQTIWPDDEVVFEISSLKDPSHLQNQSPLHRAAQSGRILNVAHLLMNGARINAVDGTNSTPLFIATQAGHDDVALFLLEMGAKMTILNNDTKDSVLHVAATQGNVKLLECFLNHPASKTLINQGDYEGKTPLHKAVLGGHSKHLTVDLLCKHGADVLATTEHGYIPLHWACKHGHLESVKILIEKNSPIDLVNINQDSPFDLAMREKQDETVHYLLKTKERLPKAKQRENQTLEHFYQYQILQAQTGNLIEEHILYLIKLIHLYHLENKQSMSYQILKETIELQKTNLNNPNLERYLSKLQDDLKSKDT